MNSIQNISFLNNYFIWTAAFDEIVPRHGKITFHFLKIISKILVHLPTKIHITQCKAESTTADAKTLNLCRLSETFFEDSLEVFPLLCHGVKVNNISYSEKINILIICSYFIIPNVD